MNKYRKLSITLLIISVIFIILGGTLSLWTWNSSENKNVVFNTASNLQDYIIYDEGESKFVGDFQVSDSYLDGVHTTISLYKTEEVNDVDLYATINMDINSIGKNIKSLPGLKWVVTSGNSTDSNREILSQGNFLGTNDGDTLVLYNNIEVLTTKKEFTIWLWLDSSSNLDSELTGETIDTSIWTQIDQIIENRYEITNISVYNKMISATVVNSTANIMYYQVTTSNTEPTEWIEIPEEDIGNIYTLEYNALNTGTNYVWFKDSNNKVISKDIHVYETYNITYLDVGGTTFGGVHDEEYPQTYNTGGITYLDMPIKEGYSFSGYYLNSDGSGEVITSISESQVGNLTLYAKWIDNIAPYGTANLSLTDGVFTLTLSDYVDKGSGLINTYGYALSTSSTCSGVTYTESSELSMEFNDIYEFDTKYYGCIKLTDNAGNVGYMISGKIEYKTNNVENLYTTPGSYEYVIQQQGLYKLEAWGAQGGTYNKYIGGYGGYSTGDIFLNKGNVLYINVGGLGGSENTTKNNGGYNGGGFSGNNANYKSFGGGGATHIALSSGLLSTFSSKIDDILIVAGGGGGATSGSTTSAGSGGGFIGNKGTASNASFNNSTYIPGGGTQIGPGYAYGGTTRQGLFGSGKQSNTSGWGGGGGGYYGGSNGNGTTGAGGSGYIGNGLLTNKYMYCYDCSTSSDENTKTYSTINVSSDPISNYAKEGDGAVKITSYLAINNNTILLTYNNNKGSGCYNKSITFNEKYGVLCTPIRRGYTFDGWYTSMNGGTLVTKDTLVISDTNHTIYAHWTKATKPIITFETNGNGGYTKDGISSRIIVTKGNNALDTTTFKYIFSNDINAEPTTSFINGNTYSLNEGEGAYYLIAEACDINGECIKEISEPFYLDTVGSRASLNLSSLKNVITVNVGAYDNGSGILKYGYLIQEDSTCPVSGYTESNNANYTFSVPSKGNYYVCVKVYDNVNNNNVISNSIYLDLPLNGAEPVLDEGMIPITFDVLGDNTIIKTVSADDTSWYNYDNKEWANVILVTEESRDTYLNTTGVEVNQSDILAYFVWIPRYKYKIWTLSESSTGEEQEIEIIFQPSSEISEGSQVGEYITHPAFWLDDDSDGVREDDEELSGIWVGKFESTGNGTTPTILPDKKSLKNQTTLKAFQTSLKFAGGTLSKSEVTFSGSATYGLSANSDSHMMKNSEWGAVAYLSHSKYGVNREIYINNSSGYYTGRSGGNVGGSTPINETYSGQSSTTQYNTYGFYTWDGYLLNYNTNVKSTTRDLTKVASTTGNITGIYDMSGGSYERVMGNYKDTIASSGFSTLPVNKYYDKYSTTSSLTACSDGICYGHALSETLLWYSDSKRMTTSSNPWFNRGGYYNDKVKAGIFYFGIANGAASSNTGFRVVLANQ